MVANFPPFVRTVAALKLNFFAAYTFTYVSEDDFELPESAFLTCRFWLIDARWKFRRCDNAIEVFNHAPQYRSGKEKDFCAFGWSGCKRSLQEDQTYSKAGLILSAARQLRSWEDRHWHD